VTAERERNHRALDGAGFLEPEIADAFEESGIKPERGKRDGRRIAIDRFEGWRVRLTRRVMFGDVMWASA
jgi:hypothetical protein